MTIDERADSRRTKTARAVKTVLRNYRDLGEHGFGTPKWQVSGDFYDQVDSARQWFAASPERALNMMRRGDSYYLKHRIEEDQGGYISNGAAIVAALLNGYVALRITPGSQNCVFPTSRRVRKPRPI